MSDIPRVPLNDGRSIPQLGFGVYRIPPSKTVSAVGEALAAGYRHIDTAEGYDNEREVGAAIHASGLERDQIFVTSKLRDAAHEPDEARRAFDKTLADLGVEYVDLFLIHHPGHSEQENASAWSALEAFRREGRTRSIGVANFSVAELDRLAASSDTVPAVNQVRVNPWYRNDALRAHHRAQGIVTEAWGPLGQGLVATDQRLARIAAKIGRTPAQVVLRWHMQRGDVAIPKTLSAERMRENLDAFGWELEPPAFAEVTALQSTLRRAIRSIRYRASTVWADIIGQQARA
jgi:2,5-diketo-D-gluconate reductase A